MKILQTRALLPVALLVLVICALFLLRTSVRRPPQPATPLAPEATASQQSPAQETPPLLHRSHTTRSLEMTDAEKSKLAKDFKERYKPLVEKWATAYEDRIPFRAEEFTLDKFHSRFGDYMFTFMIGDTTFTIQDSKLGLKVSYLMTAKAAKELNQLPKDGFVRDLQVPVTTEQITRMVKADSGVEFKPNEVVIKPTAAACALNGGAFVDLIPAGADPNNGLNSKISMVFDQSGILISYARHPMF